MWRRVLSDALEQGSTFDSEFRIVRPGGIVRTLHSLGEVVKDRSGHPSRMLWSVLDITEQRLTEDALRGSAEQLSALSRRLVEVQEAERRKLSRELHDRVGQNLTALSINLDILRTRLAGTDYVEHRARLSDSAALLEATVDSIEDVMAELRPPMLDDYGLLPALHWYTKDFSRRTGIDVRVAGDEVIERAAPEIEITIFRIAQEALTNVAKHAHAARVQIKLTQNDGHCTMTLCDDGIGIDGAHRRRHGLGMINMRERTQAVGGTFIVRNLPGGGTQITVDIPRHEHPHTDS
jgi:two-component system sensor histidine kinase UhpB